MKRKKEVIYGTTRWRSYALCNAAMNFDAAGNTASAAALYIRALEADDANIAARMNLGALLLESEDNRVHSAMKQLSIAKQEAILDDRTENDAVYYSATFRLAAAMYQQNQLKQALHEAKELDAEIVKALNAIRERRKTPRKNRMRYARLRRILGLRRLAARLRTRFRRNLLRLLENDFLFEQFLQQLKPSVVVMIAGLEKESGKNVPPPKIADRDLWRPTAAFQYNLACTAAVWLKHALVQLESAVKKTETTRDFIIDNAIGDEREDDVRAAKKQLASLQKMIGKWSAEVDRWKADTFAHLEFALRLDARMASWAARDRSMQPLRGDDRFADLLAYYKPAPVTNPQPAAQNPPVAVTPAAAVGVVNSQPAMATS